MSVELSNVQHELLLHDREDSGSPVISLQVCDPPVEIQEPYKELKSPLPLTKAMYKSQFCVQKTNSEINVIKLQKNVEAEPVFLSGNLNFKDRQIPCSPDKKSNIDSSKLHFLKNTATDSITQKSFSKRDLFQKRLQQNSPLKIKGEDSCRSNKSSMSSFSINSCQSSPYFNLQKQQFSDTAPVDSNVATFEEKFVVEDIILGEGCSSVVKICHLRENYNNQTVSNSIMDLQKQISKQIHTRFYLQRKQASYNGIRDATPKEDVDEHKETQEFNDIQVELDSSVLSIHKDFRSDKQREYNCKSEKHSFKWDQNKDGEQPQRFAVKIIRSKDEEYFQIALKEYNLLKNLNHPGIIKMPEAFLNIQRETLYLVMDYVEGHTLRKYVKQQNNQNQMSTVVRQGLNLTICKSIVKQLLEILKYLHSDDISVCHRDINPNNIMVKKQSDHNNVEIILIDFNVSRKFRDSDNNPFLMITNTGAAAFSAPELQQNNSYSEKIDLWGVGCCLYFALFGCDPFPQKTQDELSEAIKDGKYQKDEVLWNALPNEVIDLLQNLLCVDPNMRFNVTQALSHSWLQHDD